MLHEEMLAKEPKLCPFCNGNHYLPSCSEFQAKNIEERNDFIQNQKRCFGCLRTGHISKNCRVRHTCQKCQGRHPTVLHDDSKKFKKDENRKSAVSLSVNNGYLGTTSVVPVWVSTVDNPRREKLVYALLDTQSDSTFIETRVCEELSVSTEPVKLKLTTMLGRDVSVTCKRIGGLRVRGYTSGHYIDLPSTYTQEVIPLDREHIPTRETAMRWDHLTSIAPEMSPLLDCEVGLLIGYNCSTALAPRQVISGEDDQPYAVKTDLGWSIVGTSPSDGPADLTGFCHRTSIREIPAVTPSDVLKVLESDFKDSNFNDTSLSQSDLRFLKILENGVVQNDKGHIEMPLPFTARPQLPNNKKLAETRLLHLKRRLDSDPKYKEHYAEFMDGMIRDGDAELANAETMAGEVYYIPHHGVYHSKKPDKLRIVFDCSARYRGSSLNDHLLSGPDLTNSLLGVLCRFRRHPIAIMCDVEKMFHRFHVNPEDRDYLRFLWWERGDTSKEPRDHRMNVHLFGATSSPGCANFGLKHISKVYEEEFALAAPFLRQDFYVDDGVTSVENVETAIQLVTESRELCAKGKLRLHKFVSNNRALVESIPVSERATGLQEVDLTKSDGHPLERTLGVQWCIASDVFTFQVQVKEQPETRRGILSTVASIYDPLGFLAPFVLCGKIILQEMCRQGVSWDDALPKELQPRWQSWKADISNLASVKIPRAYKPSEFGTAERVELHHFSDASTSGYGVCSYIRFIGKDDVHCALVMAKSRVCPIKVMTIPRLELTAAVVAVKMSCRLKDELQMQFSGEYFWCDSQVVLAYINSEARRFHVFVANRVQFIREHTKMNQWQYVSTKDNPADHASRGLSATDLSTSNWFEGPKFLWRTDLVINVSSKPDLVLGDPEIKAYVFNVASVRSNDVLDRLRRISSWSLLERAIARIHRLAQGIGGDRPLTVQEIDEAGRRVIRLVQCDAFADEMQALMKQQNALTSSKLYSLSPFLQDGVIRVGGRIRNASLAFDVRHPVVLPRHSHVTQLIVAHFHAKTHQGRGQTLCSIRNSGYWIIGGSQAVAQFIHSCVQCRKLRRPVEEQKMADLPEDRLEPSPPFTYVGMDCFGPFLIRRGRSEMKRYGLLLTCLCSRGIHIEMLDDMTTDALINGLRCFIAIRGAVRQIRCDQGSNFVGAKNEFAASMNELQPDRIASYLLQNQCDFVFNAPCSSHAGGVWERQIRTVRNVLNSTLGLCPGRLDDPSLRTLFYEAMAIVNSRPVAAVSSDPSEEPLTPNHLITLKSAVPLPPPGSFVKEDMYARKRWRRVQYLTEQFWSRWRKEYMLSLNKRQKWNVPRRNVQIGDVVLLADDDAPRMQWPRGIVVDTKPSNDGLVRRVKVRTGASTVLERPIQKIVVILETSN